MLDQRIIIREMLPSDCVKVQKLFVECFHDPWTLSGVEEMFQTSGYYNLVACLNDTICGYVGIKAAWDEADIVNVAVSPLMRRQGLAAKLLKQLLKLAADHNISRIFLEVRQSNTPAIQLYEGAGFQSIGIRKNYYTCPTENAILMVWE